MKHVSRILIPSLLLACGAAQAQAPSRAQQQQAPAQQQQAPAQQQQAPASQQTQQQAPAPQPATAEQTASCNKVADQLIGEIGKGDYSTAAKSFDPKLGVNEDKLKQLWSQLSDKFGNVKNVGQSQQGQQIQGYTVLLVPVKFDKGDLAAQVACDSKGSVAVLRFGQMPSSSPGTGASAQPKS